MGRLSKTRLPPRVDGPNKGTLTLRLGPLSWQPGHDPGGVVVAVRWWGDDGPGDLLEPGPAADTALHFHLCSGPKYVTRYLRDMGTLVLLLKQPVARAAAAGSRSSMESAIVGTASVDVRSLDVGAPVAAAAAVVGEQGRAIGSMPVSLALAFSSEVVSSFELNEHLVAVEEEGGAVQGPKEVAAGADAAAGAGLCSVPAAIAGGAAGGDDVPAAEEDLASTKDGLRPPSTLRELEAAISGDALGKAIQHIGLGEGSRPDAEALERFVRQLLPAVSAGAGSYAATVLSLGLPGSAGQLAEEQAATPGSRDMLSEAVREGAQVERRLQEDHGGVARKLVGLCSLLSSWHLEVARAFGREKEVSYPQLVGILRGLSPSASASELSSLLAALAGMEEAGTGKVSLPSLKRTISALLYEQAFPTAEELLQQQRAAAARKEKTAASAGVRAATAAAPALGASERRQEVMGRLRSTLGQRQQDKSKSHLASSSAVEGEVRHEEAAGKAQLTAAAAPVSTGGIMAVGLGVPNSVLGQPLAAASQPTQPAASAVAAPTAVPGAASSRAAGTCSSASVVLGVPVGAAGALPVPLLAQPVPLVPAQPLLDTIFPSQQLLLDPASQPATTVGVGVPQAHCGGQYQPVQQTQPLLPALGDPLEALISRAEQLKLAMSRATLNPLQPALLGAPASLAPPPTTASGASFGLGLWPPVAGVPPPVLKPQPGGILGSAATSSSMALGTAVCNSSAHVAPPAIEPAAVGPAGGVGPDLPADMQSSLAAATAGLETAARGCHLSAASAAFVAAARALTGTQQQQQAREPASNASCAVGAVAAASVAGGSGIYGHGGSYAATESQAQHSSNSAGAPTTSLALAEPLPAQDSWDDPAELAEDIILQELFFSRPAAASSSASGAATAVSAELGTSGPSSASLTKRQEQQEQGLTLPGREVVPAPLRPELVLALRLSAMRLLHSLARGPGGTAGAAVEAPWGLARWGNTVARGVIKPLHPSAQPVAFSMAAECSSAERNAGSGAGGAPAPVQFESPHAAPAGVEVEVTIPLACVEQGRLPPILFIEVWDQAGRLMGIVRPTLSTCRLPEAPEEPCGGAAGASSGGSLPAVVCEGRWDVWNVLEGRTEGSVDVFAMVQERGQPRVVPGVQHGFSVTIQTAYRLPGNAAYAEAELQGPDSRCIKYIFPGEPEPLYTKDVPVMSNPTFDATAHHSITLLPEQDITSVLALGSGTRRLRFEVWDQWVDGKQELHAWAEMPMSELAGLARDAAASNTIPAGAEGLAEDGTGSGPAASRSHLLPLLTEYDAGTSTAAAAKGPALRVDLAYRAKRMLMPAPSATEGAPPPATGPDAAQPARVQHGQLPGHGQQRQERLLRPGNAGAAAGRGPGQALDSAFGQQRPNQQGSHGHGHAMAAPLNGERLELTGHAADIWNEEREEEVEENNMLLANCSPARPVKPVVPAASKGIQAVLSVEIARACGLAAALREASAFASNNPALSRARKVGAHPFARLALFPSDSALQRRAPPLQTPFQAQTFCPEFHARHEYHVRLDARMLLALAEQDLLVELWHHLPRAQAVAAALSAGRSSAAAGPEAGGAGEREVFLGSASCPLLDVLRRPQGLRSWLQLKSRRGEGVGAVQLAVRLSELQGQPVFAAQPDRSPLLQCIELPGALPSQLGWLLQGEGAEAFRGQQAACIVSLEEVVPPGHEDPSGREAERPKADLYFASYRLPGAPSSHTTAAKTLTAGAGKAPAAAHAALQGRAWSTKLGHLGFFSVAAGAPLRKALASSPLTIHVYKQPAPGGRPGRVATAVGAAAPIHIGTAEVDLAGLLWPRQRGGPAVRTVSGSFPLVDPLASTLGSAHIRLKVILDLREGASPPGAPALALHPGADALEACWELDGEEGAEAGRGQQGQPAPQRPALQQTAQQAPPGQQQWQQRSWSEGSTGCGSSVGGAPPGTDACSPVPGNGNGAAFPGTASRNAPADSAAQREPALHPRPASCREPELPALPRPPAQSGPSPSLHSGPAVLVERGSDAGSGSSWQSGASSGSSSRRGSASAPQPSGSGNGRDSTDSSHTAGSGGNALPSQQLAREEPQQPSAQQPPSGSLLVRVEAAVHLPASRPGSAAALHRPGSGGGASAPSTGDYAAYVSLSWGPQKRKHSTAAVAVRGLEGPSGGSAGWEEVLELEADAAMFPSLGGGGPNAGAPAGEASRGKAAAGGPVLLLNVWSCTATAPAAGSQPGPQATSPLPAAGVGHTLIGCAAVDLSTLPLLLEVRGYWNIVDYLQQVKGQLLVCIRPNDALLAQLLGARSWRGWGSGPAALPTALRMGVAERIAGSEAAQPRQEAAAAPPPQACSEGEAAPQLPAEACSPAVVQPHDPDSQPAVPSRALATPGKSSGLGGGSLESGAPGGGSSSSSRSSSSMPAGGEAPLEQDGEPRPDALLGELGVRMQALQLLSQRLSRHASAAEEPATAPSGSSQGNVRGLPACAAGEGRRDSSGEGEGVQRPAEGEGRSEPVRLREIEASDDEYDQGDLLRLMARRGSQQAGRMAWSDTDSNDDLALLGVAVEGAVSPGAESEEEPQHREPKAPRQPALLWDDDWMFDISRPQPVQPAAATAVEQREGQPGTELAPGGAAGDGGGPTGVSPAPRVSFQNVLLPNLPASPLQPALDEAQQGGAGTSAPCPPTDGAAVEPPSSQRPLPVMPQAPAARRPSLPAGPPVAPRGALLGMGVGFSAGGSPHDSWLFDISKRPEPAQGAAGLVSPALQQAGLPPHGTPTSLHQYLTLRPTAASMPGAASSSATGPRSPEAAGLEQS